MTNTTNRASRAIATKLDAVYQLITNSLKEAAVASVVKDYGYDAAELQRGMGLYETALQAVVAHDAAKSVKRRSTQDASAADALLTRSCCALAELARTQFAPRSPERQALGLTRSTPRSRAPLITFATTLYTAAQTEPAIAAHLATRQYPAARLAAEAAQIAVVRECGAAQTRATAGATHATHEQRRALAVLSAWATSYRAVARHALADAPHLRTALKL